MIDYQLPRSRVGIQYKVLTYQHLPVPKSATCNVGRFPAFMHEARGIPGRLTDIMFCRT